ncbi:MAG: hypothetical protein JRJ66_03020 [Deltaproteobacteria bacterium]|nr:hypothetical protein [Deltaproteobacteria bacterium]MBW1918788.1 hypothetical protein [Deltaproteobacteria bacterium]
MKRIKQYGAKGERWRVYPPRLYGGFTRRLYGGFTGFYAGPARTGGQRSK